MSPPAIEVNGLTKHFRTTAVVDDLTFRIPAGSICPEWDHALAARLIDEFRLRRQGRFGVLSRGQKRKAMLLLALCQRADLLIFDEPTSGLDVESRRRFLDCLLDVALEGNRTVLLSSHILSDIERIADRIVILQNGGLLVEGALEDLKAETRRIFIQHAVPRSVLDEHFRIHACDQRADGTTVATVLNYSEETFARFVSSFPPAARQTIEVNGFNLEELYLTLTGSGFRTHTAGPHLSLAGNHVKA